MSSAAALRLASVAGASFLGGAWAGQKSAFVQDSTAVKADPASAKVATTATHSSILKHGVPSPLGPSGPLCYSNHCLQFDSQRRTPIWVAEHLSKEKTFPEKV